ncbi:MAG TPA: CAP domain-containing protein [Steroidobacteraceae bacterium]
MKRLLLVLIGLGAALGAAASPLNAVNTARLKSCGHIAALRPLTDNLKLDAAVKHMADGASMAAALAQGGYLADHSSIIHVSGASSDGDVSGLLAAHYCRTLTDSAFRDIGVQRRGSELWLLLAAPVALPPKSPKAVSLEILDLVNAARAEGRRCGSKIFAPAAPLALDSRLGAAALAHSNDMAAHDLFEHRGSDGSSPADRAVRAGYKDYSLVGENIAAGAMSPREVTEGWLASPAHCENIMDSRFTVMGVAYTQNLKTASLVFWSQEFAAPRGR